MLRALSHRVGRRVTTVRKLEHKLPVWDPFTEFTKERPSSDLSDIPFSLPSTFTQWLHLKIVHLKLEKPGWSRGFWVVLPADGAPGTGGGCPASWEQPTACKLQ